MGCHAVDTSRNKTLLLLRNVEYGNKQYEIYLNWLFKNKKKKKIKTT